MKNQKKKKTFNVVFHPYTGKAPGADFSLFGMTGHTANLITLAKFQVNRSKALGSTGAQNLAFSIDFDRRLDKNVTHYRATEMSEFHNPSPKIRGPYIPPKNLGPKTCKISVDFIQPPTLIANISGTAQDL